MLSRKACTRFPSTSAGADWYALWTSFSTFRAHCCKISPMRWTRFFSCAWITCSRWTSLYLVITSLKLDFVGWPRRCSIKQRNFEPPQTPLRLQLWSSLMPSSRRQSEFQPQWYGSHVEESDLSLLWVLCRRSHECFLMRTCSSWRRTCSSLSRYNYSFNQRACCSLSRCSCSPKRLACSSWWRACS